MNGVSVGDEFFFWETSHCYPSAFFWKYAFRDQSCFLIFFAPDAFHFRRKKILCRKFFCGPGWPKPYCRGWGCDGDEKRWFFAHQAPILYETCQICFPMNWAWAGSYLIVGVIRQLFHQPAACLAAGEWILHRIHSPPQGAGFWGRPRLRILEGWVLCWATVCASFPKHLWVWSEPMIT